MVVLRDSGASASSLEDGHDDRPRKRKRNRQTLSCLACHRRKQKCDRGRPCRTCQERDIPEECRYEVEKSGGEHQDERTTGEAMMAESIVESKPTTEKRKGQRTSRTLERTTDPLMARVERLEDMLKQKEAVEETREDRYVGEGENTLQKILQPVLGQDTDLDAVAALNQLAQGQAAEGFGLGLGEHHAQAGTTTSNDINVFEWMKHLPQNRDINEIDLSFFDSPSGSSSRSGVQSLRSIASRLPERQRSDELLESFFSQWHPFYDVLVEQDYRADYAQLWDRLFEHIFRSPNPLRNDEVANYALEIALLASILAIGAHLETDLIDSPSDVMATQMDYLSKRALQLCPIPIASTGAISTDPIKYMQILTYQWCYLEQIGKIAESWEVIGRAVRIAAGLGYHRDMRHLNIMAEKEIAQRERQWWTIFRADRMSSAVIGFPYGIDERHCDVPDPEIRPGIGNDQFDYDECLRYEVEIARLTGKLTDVQLSPTTTAYGDILAMEKGIKRAIEDFAPKFEVRPSMSASDQATSLLPFKIATLSPMKHAGYIALHQRFLYQSTAESGCTEDELEHSRAVAVEHAIALLNVQLDLIHLFLAMGRDSRPRYRYLRWFSAVFFIFCPATVLCIHIIRSPSLADPGWLTLVEQADHALQRLENINPIARSAARVLSILKAKAKIFLKRQAELAEQQLEGREEDTAAEDRSKRAEDGREGAHYISAANALFFKQAHTQLNAVPDPSSSLFRRGESQGSERRKGRHYGLRPDSRGWPSMIDLLHYGGIARMAPSDWFIFFENVSAK